MVTIFKNIKETSTPFYRSVDFVLDRIRNGVHKELIASIRAENDKTKRNDLKKGLPAICFSGTFSKRSDDALDEYSGLICLDFDGYKDESDMLDDKSIIGADDYVMSVFVSPSGNGLKALVKVPNDPDNHKRYFEALREHFNSDYFDVTSKNISRVCYESYDPDIHVNENSLVWDKMTEKSYKEVDRRTPTIPITDDNKIIDILTKWWLKKYPMIEGERNNNVFILASALNEYGINKSLADYVLGQYSTDSFPMSEIRQTIDSAYRNVSAHNTKCYEDDSAMSKIRTKLSRGNSVQSISMEMPNVDNDIISAVVKDLEKDSFVYKFWSVSSKGTISLVHYLFKEFLQHKGFFKYAPPGSKMYGFVKVTHNLIDKASEEEIKDFVLDYLLTLDDLSVYNFFADKTRYFKSDFLSLLDTVDVHFVEDTKEFSFIYFRNCAIKVSADSVEKVDYVDLEGYVWGDQVIDRDFDFSNTIDCDFKKFVSNIAGDEQDRIASIESTIGFMMSGYKDPGFCPSVILNDEVITENPEGGTGKGLLIQGVSKMKKVAMIDGKSFTFDAPFAYQTITTDTQLISFDDVKKAFDFERLFSAITEGLTIERKNKDAIRIPFKFSPKIIITTNYAIRGRGNSFERRKWELELKQYYSKGFTPVDEFGRRLFDEWDFEEWLAFDNYMVNNLKNYLSTGLVKAEFKNSAIRKLGADTHHEFIEWMGVVEGFKKPDILKYDTKIFKDDIYNEFVKDNPDFAPKAKMTISRTVFYKWLISYGDYNKDVEVKESRSSQGRWIMFKTKDYEDKDNSVGGFEF